MKKPTILVLEGLSGSTSAVRRQGGDPVTVSPSDFDEIEITLDTLQIDGLLLSGGGDVNPRLYNRKPHKKVYGMSPDRDNAEMYAIMVARELDIPVLGICRGTQIQNVEAGGTLRQHIGGHYGTHPVIVTPGSTFAKAVGNRKIVHVTSLHHQEVGHLAKGWAFTGRAPDNTVEAIETEDGRCLGVQFHPEMDQKSPYARDIFRWLIMEAGERAGIDMSRNTITTQPQFPALYSGDEAWQTSNTTTRTTVTTKGQSPVTYRWFCPYEGIRFDRFNDFADHMEMLHDELVPLG